MPISAFRQYQRVRGLSEKTIRRRDVTLRLFQRHIAPLSLFEASGDLIDDWLGCYRVAATRRAYRSDLQAYFSWAARRDWCDTNPVLRTDSIRVPKPLPRPVPASHLPLILESATPDLRLMIALAAFAGLRVSEIAALDTSDLDLISESPTLTVRCGKGAKDRTVPIHPNLARLLRESKIRSGPVVRVSASTVGRVIAEHLRSLGIEATAHKLRATFGTELARTTTGNLVLLAKLMGHTDPATSMRYVGWHGGPGASAVAAMYPPAA